MADHSTSMPPGVTELLRAIVDALDMPRPRNGEDDKRAHLRILDDRADSVRIIAKSALDIIGSGLAEDARIAAATAHLRRWTAEEPITYTPYEPPPAPAAAQPGTGADAQDEAGR
jgi:hypothetical protein